MANNKSKVNNIEALRRIELLYDEIRNKIKPILELYHIFVDTEDITGWSTFKYNGDSEWMIRASYVKNWIYNDRGEEEFPCSWLFMSIDEVRCLKEQLDEERKRKREIEMKVKQKEQAAMQEAAERAELARLKAKYDVDGAGA